MRCFYRNNRPGTVTFVLPGARFALAYGENQLSESDGLALQQDDIGKQMVADGMLEWLDNPAEPAAESLDEIGYVPLTPTVEQLTPLPTVGTATANAIIKNTPKGGYVSPEQLIELNALAVEVSLVEALFEIA